MIFICCSYNFTYKLQYILRRTALLFCLNQYIYSGILSPHAVSFERIAKRDNLDVSELSLPGRQCRFSWQWPSSFYFVKRTKTAARTSRAIYMACRRARLRAKSCPGQEMRRVILLPSLFFTRKFLHFLPFSASRPVYASFTRIAKYY